MAKRKLKRFAEIKTFSHVFEPTLDQVRSAGYYMKGNWSSGFFKNSKPVILELGCGKGEYTVGLAEKYRDKNFIGVDIKGARIWRGASSALEKKLSNVAFLRTRIEFIDSFFSAGEVDEIWITFPDPQPQKPRERKRLTHLRFLMMYKKFLSQSGFIHLKTDNEGLYNYTKDVLEDNRFTILECTNDLYGSYETNRHPGATAIQTYYESLYLSKGSKICYLKFTL